MAKLADASDLGSGALGRVGSSPTIGTIAYYQMAATPRRRTEERVGKQTQKSSYGCFSF